MPTAAPTHSGGRGECGGGDSVSTTGAPVPVAGRVACVCTVGGAVVVGAGSVVVVGPVVLTVVEAPAAAAAPTALPATVVAGAVVAGVDVDVAPGMVVPDVPTVVVGPTVLVGGAADMVTVAEAAPRARSPQATTFSVVGPGGTAEASTTTSKSTDEAGS
jgi:hypothetical protein